MHVAIVGAGPSGAWAAHQLARRGARVTIFDPSHPREKPCGGGVTGRAIELVAHAIGPQDWPATVVRSARFLLRASGCRASGASPGQVDVAGRQSATVPLDADALVVASRREFDSALLAAAVAAGATHSRLRVTDVAAHPAAGGMRITTTAGSEHVDFVIGADGANGIVRRRLARAFGRDQLSIATGFFAHGTTSDEIVIELVSDPPGYIWSFPRPDHLAVGICAQADAVIGAAALRERTAAWVRDSGIAPGARLQPYSWPIPSLAARDFSALTLAGQSWCLTGDAAGLVDPITREGIYFAIASGSWAAEALGSGAVDGSADRYEAMVRAHAIPELARAARLKAGFFRPAFTGLMLAALQHSAGIRAATADLVAGRQSYRTLKWRLLKTFEVGLAWQALRQTRVSRP
jgi:geranylgeranyl reductase family protein